MQSVYEVSEPTSSKLCLCRAFEYGFRTYLQGTVGRECSLNVFVPNLPPGDCWQRVHPECICSEPTSRGLFAGGASCFTVSKPSSWGLSVRGYRLFKRIRTYFQGTVKNGCSLFIRFLNLPLGIYLPGWSLFIWFLNLPPGDCL